MVGDFEAVDCCGIGDIGLAAEVLQHAAQRLGGVLVQDELFASGTLFTYPRQRDRFPFQMVIKRFAAIRRKVV